MNQREIKFRAWVYGMSKMVDVMALNIGSSIYVSRFQVYGKTGDDLLLQPMTEGEKVFELMQYTNLKDKNGKEIYEGDIIETIYEKGHCTGSGKKGTIIYKRKGIVEWEDTYWGMKGFCIKEKEPTIYCCSINRQKSIEVIGNIYEDKVK